MVIAAVILALTPTRANAVATPVPLGTAASFGVLAGATVTNTGPTVVNGRNVGVSPGSAITGFFASDGGPGIVTPPGTLHAADGVAALAKNHLTTGYNQAAGQVPPNAVYNDAPHEFGGQTLTPGIYKANSSAAITGTLTLDALGNPNAVWVFQIGSALTTASNSTVSFVNGASPCNVFWQVGSSAVLGTESEFGGTILAHTSITANTDASINGRLLADAGGTGLGAVTLDTNNIFLGPCADGTTGGTTTVGGVISGGVLGGVLTGGTTVGGVIGGVLGGVLSGGTSGGTDGGTSGGTDGGTSGGTPGGASGGTLGGGAAGGVIGGPGGHHGEKPGRHHGEKPGGHEHGEKPGGHEHGEKPGGHEGKPGGHEGKPGGHEGKPGKPGKPEKPGKPDGYGSVRESHDKKSA
ncbi:ice-binding family protein [Streptomyces sp. MMG1533]|uniref:ice-binding family protein n=1 Tax=Streptomyces sp. MMG1533 TaxID=1415546 RepID=UPI001F459C26|nr:ice-binding family protein [Streptomyces sp. MMG1533]